MSKPPPGNHDDAASALMALAGNTDKHAPANEISIESSGNGDVDLQSVESTRSSPPPSPAVKPNTAATANRFPNKVRVQ